MQFKSEYYNETLIESMIFSYGFKKGRIPDKDTINLNVNFITINVMKLPISMNPMDYGRLINKNGMVYILQNDKGQTITFTKFEKHNLVEFFKSGTSLVKFKDEIINENKFTRIIDNKKYSFENGQQVLFTKEIKNKFISRTKKSNKLVDNFITLDIETYVHNNILIPYLICFYDGKNSYSFGIWDYSNVDEMIIDCLTSIMSRKYNGYNVYMHNMAKFDIIFLFKYLIELGLVEPIIHNNRIISIDFNFGVDNKYQIKFKDSLLLLLQGLDKLCKSFKVENGKSIFPHLFVKESNLDYIGDVPDIK